MAHDDDRGDGMLEERLAGASSRAIAKRHRCSSVEVEAAIDQRLDYALDNEMRLRCIKLDVARLEALMVPFFERATKDRDVAAGTLCCKILERRALLLGLDSPTRVDIVQLETQQKPSRYDRITEAVMKLRMNGNESPPDVDNAVGALSDTEPSKPK